MSELLTDIWSRVQILPPLIQGVGLILVALLLVFIFRFLIPGLRLNRRLTHALKALKSADLSGSVNLAPAFKERGVLVHLWNEYYETLHPERTLDPASGEMRITALRATQPAAVYFTEEVVVDSVVGTEFFKHLPGLFTGFGIIGTFLGLIHGLSNFHPTEDAGVVRESLGNLIASVSEAFLVSAFAIVLAMVTTAIEKGLLVRLYKKAEALTHAIDERFKSGVGEEYLSRLVSASEESATQTRILKDSLVEDLRALMMEVAERQIAAQSAANSQLGDRIAQAFSTGLSGPMEKIANAVDQVGKDQGSAVQTLLTDVLAEFSDKIERMFGGQLSGIHELQQQTVAALQGAVTHLGDVARTIEGAGTKAADSMAQQMTDAIRKMESRQTVLNDQMKHFVEDIRDLVKNSQKETGTHLQDLLAELTSKTGSVIGALSEQSHKQINGMGAQLNAVTEAVGGATVQIARAVERLEAVTTDAIGQMNSSARVLAGAVGDFARAGDGVKDVMDRSAVAGRLLNESAGSVSTAVGSLAAVVGDYKAQQSNARGMLELAQKTVEAASREAGMTERVVQSLGEASKRLTQAQVDAGLYLEQVSEVLTTAHREFAENVTRTLKAGNQEFYESLSRGTKLLKEAINELEATVSSVPQR